MEIAKFGHVEATTPEVLVLQKSMYNERAMELIVRQHVSEAKPVLFKGDRRKDSWWEGLSDDVLENYDVWPNRQCEVFGDSSHKFHSTCLIFCRPRRARERVGRLCHRDDCR